MGFVELDHVACATAAGRLGMDLDAFYLALARADQTAEGRALLAMVEAEREQADDRARKILRGAAGASLDYALGGQHMAELIAQIPELARRDIANTK